MVLQTTLDAFDSGPFIFNLASLMDGVYAHDITLSITANIRRRLLNLLAPPAPPTPEPEGPRLLQAASSGILVNATIRINIPYIAGAALTSLEALSPAELSAAIGFPVQEIDGRSGFIKWNKYNYAAPSPPPPMPPMPPMQPPPPGERQPPLIPLIGAWVFGALVLFCGCCWLCCTRCLPESCSSCLPFSKAARNRRKKDKAALAAAKRFTPEAQAIYGRPGGAIYGRGPPPVIADLRKPPQQSTAAPSVVTWPKPEAEVGKPAEGGEGWSRPVTTPPRALPPPRLPISGHASMTAATRLPPKLDEENNPIRHHQQTQQVPYRQPPSLVARQQQQPVYPPGYPHVLPPSAQQQQQPSAAARAAAEMAAAAYAHGQLPQSFPPTAVPISSATVPNKGQQQDRTLSDASSADSIPAANFSTATPRGVSLSFASSPVKLADSKKGGMEMLDGSSPVKLGSAGGGKPVRRMTTTTTTVVTRQTTEEYEDGTSAVRTGAAGRSETHTTTAPPPHQLVQAGGVPETQVLIRDTQMFIEGLPAEQSPSQGRERPPSRASSQKSSPSPHRHHHRRSRPTSDDRLANWQQQPQTPQQQSPPQPQSPPPRQHGRSRPTSDDRLAAWQQQRQRSSEQRPVPASLERIRAERNHRSADPHARSSTPHHGRPHRSSPQHHHRSGSRARVADSSAFTTERAERRYDVSHERGRPPRRRRGGSDHYDSDEDLRA